MSETLPQITQMTLATTRTAEMVAFYDTLFGTHLQAVKAFGATLYHGTLAGIPLVICPNEIAGVEAKQSRHQLTLRVADLLGLLQLVEIAGGGIHTSVAEFDHQCHIEGPGRQYDRSDPSLKKIPFANSPYLKAGL